MLLSTKPELRLYLPSNAVDEVENFQGVLNNSEKSFLQDKLGNPLYKRLCEYYDSINPDEFFSAVGNGTYTNDPWQELLYCAQDMIVNDAMTRYTYQQIISVNGSGINVVSGNDYGAADDRLLDKGVSGYRKNAMLALNNLLRFLEDVAKEPEQSAEQKEITELWQQSKYYFQYTDLLIPTCTVLNAYLDIEDYRDRFIRMLPDLRFIQKNYIRDAFGKDFITQMLSAPEDDDMLDDVRTLMALYLKERTTVIAFDKVARQQAHDDAVAKKENILATLKAKEQPSSDATETTAPDASPSGQGYKNNAEGSRIFVSPLLY